MNILFVAHGFPDKNETLTGFSAYLYRVSLALIELGHKPIILASGQRNDRWVHKGIEIIRVKTGNYDVGNNSFNFMVNSYIKSYRLTREIKKLNATIKIDVIQFTSLYGTSLLYYGKIPAVMRLSSYAKTSYASYETHSKKYVKTMAWIEKSASKRCNAVFAPCKNTAVDFGKDIKRKVYMIESPYVEDIDAYDETYIETELKNKKYALFFGVLYAEKGVKVIGQCLESFLEKNSDYYFVFVGRATVIEGENAVRMLKRCAGSYKERVIALPALSHEQLYPIIWNADFVVLPSFMENLSNACIEAMYFGKVVIGTDGASFEQLIRHGVNGFLCKIGDSDDLLEKLQMAVSLDEQTKYEMGCKARKRIGRLKPEIVVKQLVDFYCYVINATTK